MADDAATVLVLDDEDGVREYVSHTLRKAGYHVQEAANGAQALDLVRICRVDVLITDLVMPEKEGLETIMSIRSGALGPKVVAMSGAVSASAYLALAHQLGANATLQKPFSGKQLLDTLSAVLGAP